ncbi:MAG: hypothetical protein HOF89_00865, partial [Candidatus Nitrosopelagicus sp.]|nr:hypothetical protein [Candidatus Nitrosopelagicus sp.]
MSNRSKVEELSEYERDYLERLATKGKIKSIQIEEPVISEEERTRKVEKAEQIQIESAHQIQEASAAKIQSELDIKNKQEFLNKEVLLLIDELKILKAQLKKEPTKRKITRKKAATKKRTTAKRKVTRKKADPKKRTTAKRKVTRKKAATKKRTT